ncbi:hypothetical protein F3Y22_tig00110392pilonHSYRG00053 [Hibiscus syriacus]|uniref:non-specific serine/threonine protein kinase n=1 Tax=Hibiscus syriacus TaxID=106335 RepID=A0A6A3APD2_HIBSY|nr:hypothetical protein F3Y22_tig00110392pilonHSYRG00053 [Hibiscus syriacus]
MREETYREDYISSEPPNLRGTTENREWQLNPPPRMEKYGVVAPRPTPTPVTAWRPPSPGQSATPPPPFMSSSGGSGSNNYSGSEIHFHHPRLVFRWVSRSQHSCLHQGDGYLAPEYASSGKLTDKSDVFSFGFMLLELITGHRPARPLLTRALDDGNFDGLVDPKLPKEFNPNEMTRMIACAAACVRHSARRRPRMSQVVRALEGDVSLSDLNEGMRLGQSVIVPFLREGRSWLGEGPSHVVLGLIQFWSGLGTSLGVFWCRLSALPNAYGPGSALVCSDVCWWMLDSLSRPLSVTFSPTSSSDALVAWLE